MMRAMPKRRPFPLLLALFCALAGQAPEAHAYLDPSTGSMILSAIVGLFATLGLAVKTYWYKLKNLVKRRRPATPATGQSAGQSAGQSVGQSAAQSAGQANRPS
jgi:peptidoglycan/LPS O-acetylase OafA/YrhL